MDRRWFLKTTPALFLPLESRAEISFPAVKAIPEPHFPSRLHQFVWRNWELANLDRMGAVVQAKPAQLAVLGRDMGLPPKRQLSPDYLRRIYITVIRQNWHLLPESQIIQLLGWDADKFAFTLKEDDFLEHKLGKVKPACDPLAFREPDANEKKKAAEIRARLSEWMPGGLRSLGAAAICLREGLIDPAAWSSLARRSPAKPARTERRLRCVSETVTASECKSSSIRRRNSDPGTSRLSRPKTGCESLALRIGQRSGHSMT